VDDANNTKTFTFTISEIDGITNINTFLITFTDQTEFSTNAYVLKFNLISISKGYLLSSSKWASVTAANFSSMSFGSEAVAWSDNSINIPGTLRGTFSSQFVTSTSNWSNSSFIINSIVDNSNNSKSFTFSISEINGTTNMNTFLITFTDQTEFGTSAYLLKFNLVNPASGYLTSSSEWSLISTPTFSTMSY